MKHHTDERVISAEFTSEFLSSLDRNNKQPVEAAKDIIEEKAERLESSMNCVVKIDNGGTYAALSVNCHYPRNAEPDIIKRGVEGLQSELMRESRGDKTYW